MTQESKFSITSEPRLGGDSFVGFLLKLTSEVEDNHVNTMTSSLFLGGDGNKGGKGEVGVGYGG